MASSRQAIWVTFAATAGTLAIVVALLAGPSIVRCSSSDKGLLSCLRQQVVDAGLMPGEEPTPDPVVVTAEPEKPAPAAAPAPAEPDLNLVRAEPDGHVIVAGTAQPGIEVEVFANGDLVGKVMAEASGDWVLVPDRPLATGRAEISVGISGSNERSPHAFTVVIPEDKTSAPVITPSRSLPAAEAEPPPVVASEPAPAPAVEPAPAPEVPPTASTPEPAPVETPKVAATRPEPKPAPPAQQANASEPPASAPPVEEAIAPEPPAPAPPIEEAIAPAPVAPAPVEPPIATAEATPPAPAPVAPTVTPVPQAPPTIDAIEIDGTANYFAGAGPEGATVQLYVQDEFIASAKVEGGRWLVEASGVLNLPVQRVRIDLFEPQHGDVSARAEVNFVIDVPPPAPDIAVTGTGEGAVAPVNSAAGALAFAPQVESVPEVDPTIPTLRALPPVEPGMMRFASGKAIIRRGETLWSIAARVYGDGSLYRRIVEANDDLITRPGRIYPGQVFDLPKLQEPAAAN